MKRALMMMALVALLTFGAAATTQAHWYGYGYRPYYGGFYGYGYRPHYGISIGIGHPYYGGYYGGYYRGYPAFGYGYRPYYGGYGYYGHYCR